MTLTNTFDPQPATFQNTVGFNRFQGISGTGGIKPAVRSQEWTDQVLIDTDQKDKAAS